MDYSEFDSSDEHEHEVFDFYDDGSPEYIIIAGSPDVCFNVNDDMSTLNLDDLAELNDIPF